MTLSGDQLRELHSALLSAFPTREALSRMVLFRLDENLEAIAAPKSLADTVFQLLQWAQARGMVEKLVAGALAENPASPFLREFAARMGLTAPPAAPEARAAPREAVAPTVFFSYSHKDESLRDELEKHLSLLKRQRLISGWHNRMVQAGQEQDVEIRQQLERAEVILLLISADFLASDYCYSEEMDRALQRHRAGEALVIPIILRPCDWHEAPFSKLKPLPQDGQPVTRWADRDEAFTDIAKGIRSALSTRAPKK